MPAKTVKVHGSLVKVPLLSVAQVIEMSALVWNESRSEILEDLKDSNASDEVTLEALKQHRETKGHTMNVVRWALTAQGAKEVIKQATGDFPSEFEELKIEQIIEIAVGCLGVDWDELASTEGSAEGNAKDQSEAAT